jgi:predicted small lipoprotein YifL
MMKTYGLECGKGRPLLMPGKEKKQTKKIKTSQNDLFTLDGLI